jgi:cytochrome c-type biogenesis protein
MSAFGPFALALVAGIVSFTSPCCLPLMPGYVSFIAGVASDPVDGDGVAVRRRTTAAALLFVTGFALTFTAMGAGASAIGGTVLRHRDGLTKVAGVFVIAMGLVTIGALRIPFLMREGRLLRRAPAGLSGALPLGVAFALGWTPCIGPVLAAILTGAAAARGVGRGAALLLVYSLGLGIPFLVLARGYARGGRVFAWFRRHGRAVESVGGCVLLLMGVLMITGEWVRLFVPLIRLFSRSGWPPV